MFCSDPLYNLLFNPNPTRVKNLVTSLRVGSDQKGIGTGSQKTWLIG